MTEETGVRRGKRRGGTGIKAIRETSREAYYKVVLSGTKQDQKSRIVRYYLKKAIPMTRKMAHQFFFAGNTSSPYALDGGKPIYWESFSPALTGGVVCREDENAPVWRESVEHPGRLVNMRTGCDHRTCGAALMVDYIDICPITGAKSEFLVAIGNRFERPGQPELF